MKHTTHNTTSGFTLLFSILVATMVVAIGATIISIAIRQTILSGTSRESQYAFYAANTVLECAYYWDTTNRDLGGKSVFPAPGTTDTLVTPAEEGSVTCSNVNIILGDSPDVPPWKGLVTSGATNERTFYLKITKNPTTLSGVNIPSYTYCAEATVKKTNASGVIETTIEAKGYNTCDTTNTRRVERGLIQYYES